MPRLSTRPRIGVTGPAFRFAPGRIAACLLTLWAGGRPVWLSPRTPDALEKLECTDALIVTGGSDVGPALYGDTQTPWSEPDPPRDQFELTALRYARRRGMPVLGICRGAQLINVAAGGKLHRDIAHLRNVTSNKPFLWPRKRVGVANNSVLLKSVGREPVYVNSLHHQAVSELGDGLRIVARDDDQIVQGIEAKGGHFCVGVQWHPEYLPWRKDQRKLFHSLVRSVSSGRC